MCCSGPVRGGPWAWGAAFERLRDEARRASGRGALRHEGGGGSIGDAGEALCWGLLPPGLGWLRPKVVEDVLGGSGSRFRRGTGLGLGPEFGCGLRSRRAGGFGWLLGGGLGFRPGCGRGLRWGVGLGGGGVARVGDGFGGRLGGFPRGLRGGVLDEDVLVVADEVVVVLEVVESEAEDRAVGDGGEPWAAEAGVGCWV